jgi:prepilin-type N-terminal cleavage/methylation domain-containing protein
MNRRGVSLAEVVVVLLIVGVVAHISFAPLRRQADAIVLRAVREEVIGLFHRARSEARLHGSAELSISEGDDPLLRLSHSEIPERVAILDRGVSLEVEGIRDEVAIRYGSLGIANVASATLILRRRGAETRLVVSGYGRVRR